MCTQAWHEHSPAVVVPPSPIRSHLAAGDSPLLSSSSDSNATRSRSVLAWYARAPSSRRERLTSCAIDVS
eukprot:7390849-Prymnesium_polylepis.1